ncbi:MAG TPA: DUF2280 domain-containing protein [Dongiaceae bacterium]|jgi:hypothetical protein|nr:DUF2280 domain-containing protein [Dongiaceae bacterium]
MKTFIVMGLARFDTPLTVAAAVKSTFGVEVTRQHVHLCDPAYAQPPASRWCELHAATRPAFLADPDVAAALLEQAAKECGGIYDRARRSRGDAPAAEDGN